MGLSKQGFRRAERMLKQLPATTRKHLTQANEDNGQFVLQVARVLVPEGETGRAKAAIRGSKQGDGFLMDFGPLSSILEGGTGERTTKTGASRGRMPKRPFVNPALKATAKKRRRRSNKALRDAIREAGNG